MPELGPDSCIIRGIGQNRHTLNLQPVYNALGHELVVALPGVHCFAAYDTTGQFSGKGKLSCWKVLRSSIAAVIRAFIDLSKTALLTAQTIRGLVCQMYCPEIKIKKVRDLRWHIFERFQAETERFPPPLQH